MRRMITNKQVEAVNLSEELFKYLNVTAASNAIKYEFETHTNKTNDKVSIEYLENAPGINGEGALILSSNYWEGDNSRIYLIDDGIDVNAFSGQILINNFNGDNYISLASSASEDDYTIQVGAVGGLNLYWDDMGADTLLTLTGYLPTSDPQVEGAIWNDNGTLKISAGE